MCIKNSCDLKKDATFLKFYTKHEFEKLLIKI